MRSPDDDGDGVRWAAPVALAGRIVRLEPLAPGHLDGLVAAAADVRPWEWTPMSLADRSAVEAWLEQALRAARDGTEVPWATLDARTGRVVGSSRYLSIVPEHRRLEIGWTWLHPGWWRTGANLEAKLLMLTHAFETLGAMRVEFKTDALNLRSRAALEGAGARFEGVFRRHMRMPGGRVRDSAWYAITDDEWPAARALLVRRLAIHQGAPEGPR
jgi:RimJ/RimL family protein N-acetyltransferase